jgi:urocanate hydratase
MLLRKGWGPFGPLPLGGDRSDLDIAAEKIIEVLHPDQEE